jgi:hypothetical protein
VFIQKYVEFNKENQFLWSFEHDWDHLYDYTKLISKLEHQDIVSSFLNNPSLWKGCFGVMSVITFDFLNDMNIIFNIVNLIECTVSREDRMCLERIFAVLFTVCNQKNNIKTKSLFGDIHSHRTCGQNYETYQSKKINNQITLPIEKVWTGR